MWAALLVATGVAPGANAAGVRADRAADAAEISAVSAAVIIDASALAAGQRDRIRDRVEALLVGHGAAATLGAEGGGAELPPDGQCLDDKSCLERVALLNDVTALVMIHMKRDGRRWGGEVLVWSARAASPVVVIAPTVSRRLGAAVVGASKRALKKWQTQWDSRAMPLQPVIPLQDQPSPSEPSASSSPSNSASSTPAAPGAASSEPQTESREELIEGPEDFIPSDEGPSMALQLGGGVALSPVVHAGRGLSGAVALADYPVGGPGLVLETRFRLPVSELYLTHDYTYVFDDPLLIMTFEPGIEWRYSIGAWHPLLGARYSLGLVGMAVPNGVSGAGTFIYALSHGAVAYGGVGFDFEAIPLVVQLVGGYRLHPKPINQMSAGEARYAVDPTWTLDLSGPVIKLSALFEIEL